MTGKTEERLRKIRCRVNARRAAHEKRIFRQLTTACLFLLTGICTLWRYVMSPLDVSEGGAYGTVLLRYNAGGYVSLAVAAFAAGVLISVICIKVRQHKKGNKSDGQT